MKIEICSISLWLECHCISSFYPMVWEDKPICFKDGWIRAFQILGGRVRFNVGEKKSVTNWLTFCFRTWTEMRVDFKLRGGRPVKLTARESTEPLFLDDCSGIFLLWILMLLLGPLGWVSDILPVLTSNLWNSGPLSKVLSRMAMVPPDQETEH